MTNNKRETVLKISKHLDDPSMAEELLALFDERKKEAILNDTTNIGFLGCHQFSKQLQVRSWPSLRDNIRI